MTGEKVTLTTFGVSGSKIRFDEAYAIYAEMAKESRDRWVVRLSECVDESNFARSRSGAYDHASFLFLLQGEDFIWSSPSA